MKVWLQGWLTHWFGKIQYSFYVSDLFFFWLFYIMINSKMTAAPPELLMSNGKQRDLSSLQLFLRNVERSLANNTACTQALRSWGILQARILEWVAMPSFRGSSQTRDGSQVSHISNRSFTTEPWEKPKNTGVGSVSLLQGIFPTQESNLGLSHCMQTLYQLSYQGSPLSAVLGKQLLWSEWFKNLHRLVLKSWLEPSQCKKIDYLGLLLKFIGGREQKKLPALQLTRMIATYPRENLNSRHVLNSLGVLKIVDNNDAYLWSGEDRLLLGNVNQLGDQ